MFEGVTSPSSRSTWSAAVKSLTADGEEYVFEH